MIEVNAWKSEGEIFPPRLREIIDLTCCWQAKCIQCSLQTEFQCTKASGTNMVGVLMSSTSKSYNKSNLTLGCDTHLLTGLRFSALSSFVQSFGVSTTTGITVSFAYRVLWTSSSLVFLFLSA